MQGNAIDQALEGFASDKTEVEATLKDGSVVRGRIKSFDGYVIFMDGGNGRMVYRHSLLKIAPVTAAGTQETVVQAAENTRRERFQAKPQAKPASQPRKSDRPQRQRPQEHKPQPAAQEDTGRIGSMGEAMQKWLQSQKG